jgi:predicted RNase H-like HicB family nuclease
MGQRGGSQNPQGLKDRAMMAYRVKVEADDGTLLVSSPALPEVTTFGENVEEAEKMALGAIEEGHRRARKLWRTCSDGRCQGRPE